MTMPPNAAIPPPQRHERFVLMWLYAVTGLIFVMVIVGGATRLTDSGLSITQWQPILGAIPPLSLADWQDAFDKYRQIPEYQQVNKGMSLAEFKYIFWWEWGHRFLGRFIGLAFILPLIWFWARAAITGPLARKLAVIFVLGGLQGALGWYMVMSGLVDRVDVSQYRLAAHLGLAVVLMGWVFWTALDLQYPSRKAATAAGLTAGGLVGLVFLQVILGAFVAGLDAGQGYNTWPLMKGAVIPEGLFVMTPFVLNFFENALTVQFDHRMLAYLVILAAVLHALSQWRGGEGMDRAGALVVFALIALQAALGVWILLAGVPLDLSLAHQAGASIVMLAALWHLHRLLRR